VVAGDSAEPCHWHKGFRGLVWGLLALSPPPRLASTFLHPQSWPSVGHLQPCPAELCQHVSSSLFLLLMICLLSLPVLLQPGAFATSSGWSTSTISSSSSSITTTTLFLPQRPNVAASGPAPQAIATSSPEEDLLPNALVLPKTPSQIQINHNTISCIAN
jgi:hypothetical protein